MATKRTKAPSRAVNVGTTTGTLVGTLIEVGAAAIGVPLPVGAGAALGGLLTGLFAWASRGGRKGEAD